jgi:hypothetical protein
VTGWTLWECKRCDNIRRERGRPERCLPGFGEARKMKSRDELGVEREPEIAPWAKRRSGGESGW